MSFQNGTTGMEGKTWGYLTTFFLKKTWDFSMAEEPANFSKHVVLQQQKPSTGNV